MTIGEFPWGMHQWQGACSCWQCGGPRVWGAASTFTAMTYRQTHMTTTWADAISFAIRLRLAGATEDKPAVRRLGDRWEVRWKPRFVAFNSVA